MASCGGEKHEFRAAPWRDPMVSADGKTIRVRYETGACATLARVDVGESAESVTITIVERQKTSGDCQAIGYLKEETIALESPVGDRRLVDGARPGASK